MLRWEMIKKDGLLRCSMPKSFEAEEHFGSGYVYFTTDLNDAIVYGLSKSLLDMESDDYKKWMKLNPEFRDPVVLGINTSGLNNLEINHGINTPLVQQIPHNRNKNTQLYKYKGNIKLEHLSLYRYAPFDSFDSNDINHIRKYHQEKLHASQSIMNRIAYQPILNQLSLVKIPRL